MEYTMILDGEKFEYHEPEQVNENVITVMRLASIKDQVFEEIDKRQPEKIEVSVDLATTIVIADYEDKFSFLVNNPLNDEDELLIGHYGNKKVFLIPPTLKEEGEE